MAVLSASMKRALAKSADLVAEVVVTNAVEVVVAAAVEEADTVGRATAGAVNVATPGATSIPRVRKPGGFEDTGVERSDTPGLVYSILPAKNRPGFNQNGHQP